LSPNTLKAAPAAAPTSELRNAVSVLPITKQNGVDPKIETGQ
jgi:hypothetical protein